MNSNSTTSIDDLLDPNRALSCSLQYTECQVFRYMWIVFCPLLLLLGTFGNMTILRIMCQPALRKTAFGLYLAAISITDTIAIWTGITRHFIKNAFLYDIRHYNQYACQFQQFLLYGSFNTSVWLLVAVTIERTLSIYAPTKSAVFKNVNRTRGIIIIISIVMYGWNIVVFFIRGNDYEAVNSSSWNSTPPQQSSACGYQSQAAKKYWESYQSFIAMAIYSIIPFVLMLTLNIAIIKKLRRRDRHYKDCANVTPTVQQNGQTVKSRGVSQKTLMLLPITIFFLITTLPSLAFTAVEMKVKVKDQAKAQMELGDMVLTWLLNLNHSMNFFLLCIPGKMFRRKCAELYSCCLPTSKRYNTKHLYGTTLDTSPNIHRTELSLSPRVSPNINQIQTHSDRVQTSSDNSNHLSVPTQTTKYSPQSETSLSTDSND